MNQRGLATDQPILTSDKYGRVYAIMNLYTSCLVLADCSDSLIKPEGPLLLEAV